MKIISSKQLYVDKDDYLAIEIDPTERTHDEPAIIGIVGDEKDYDPEKDVQIIEFEKDEVYIVPIEELSDYILDGEIIKKIPKDLAMDNWECIKFKHEMDRKRHDRPVDKKVDREAKRKLNRDKFAALEILKDNAEGYLPLDIVLEVNDNDSEMIASFKAKCNRLKIRVTPENHQWIKATMKKVNDGSISSKALDELITLLGLRYRVTFD